MGRGNSREGGCASPQVPRPRAPPCRRHPPLPVRLAVRLTPRGGRLCAASARAPGDAPRGRLPAAPPHRRLLPPLTAPLPLFCSGLCACKQRRQRACNQTSRVTRAPYNPRAASAVAAKRVTLRGTAPLPRGARPSTFSPPAVHFPDGAGYTAGDDATRIACSAAAALWAFLIAAPARPAPVAPAAAELVRSHAGGACFPGPPSLPVRATPAPSLTARLNANNPSPWNTAGVPR